MNTLRVRVEKPEVKLKDNYEKFTPKNEAKMAHKAKYAMKYEWKSIFIKSLAKMTLDL